MKEELLKELKQSMIDKDELKKNTITLLRAAILQVEKDERRELSQDDMVQIVAKEVKKRRESIEDYIKGGREDIVNQIKKEIEILSKYLPEQLSNEEIEKLVDESITLTCATSPKDMGKVMQDLKAKTAGKCDGKLLSEIVRNKLSNM